MTSSQPERGFFISSRGQTSQVCIRDFPNGLISAEEKKLFCFLQMNLIE